LKRQFTVLAILTLFVVSMFCYAECWMRPAQKCAAEAVSNIGRCHKASSEPVAACRGEERASRCQSAGACAKADESDDTTDCGQTQDCKTRCFRLLPPLLAEAVHRAALLTPDDAGLWPITVHSTTIASAHTEVPVTPPPRGIHPGIATTVLRI